MEIGGVVTYRGRPWYVRGFDPHGVTPQYVYLQDARTGRRIAVRRERLTGPARPRGEPSPLHLVDPDTEESS